MKLANKITRENIEIMVLTFYGKVLKDDTVGSFFIAKLGNDINNDYWKPHILLLVNFWSSIALGDESYHGNPLAPHFSIGELNNGVFQQWLKLFFETIDSIYEPEAGVIFKERSKIIAGNFIRNLGIYT